MQTAGVAVSGKSVRWIESYEIVAEQARALPDTRLVYVADREGDIAALMQRTQELGEPADWLMRSQHNRALKGEASLWETAHASEVVGHISFVLPGRSGQKAREVRQELRSQRITLPGRAGVTLPCVEAYEVDAPAGVKPVIWRLVTNREAGDAHALIELVDWYRARWEIEMFFDGLP
ncbi:IS4 family transposase ISAzo5 [Paraburkholderia domus]|nr:IS4 family transposase ISAzo5 [Paraburkholderia domus]